ncbi:acetyltransferase [Clostridium sp. SHJSY1]|uniref:acetyltransferase n=1 Tax=Clostridium sp. SHJSY1 TaxID=2942483 RepID=UPI0028755400|nr:acetyltransferase [Clostridium sp. SHJSY1]MDS0526636.1 acetyltransferase [Clostridium sp. SHJSY1]
MKNIIIIGAGGQAQAVIDALEYYPENNVVGLLDSNKTLHGKCIGEHVVLGDISEVVELAKEKKIDSAFIAIGDSKVRIQYSKLIEELNLHVVNAIHPKCTISKKAAIGKGVFIGAGAVIGPYVQIRDYCIININAIIPHYNKISKFANIAPGVSMGGGCEIGYCSFIGIGAAIKQYVNVGDNTIVGAGAVVIKHIPNNVVYAGVPAKYIKDNFWV